MPCLVWKGNNGFQETKAYSLFSICITPKDGWDYRTKYGITHI